MDKLEEQIKNLEIREKRLRNRTIWLTATVPIITIIISLLTTTITIQKEFDLDKLNFTQKQVIELIKQQNIIVSRKKLQFLIDADLIGDKKNKDKLGIALNDNLVSEHEGMTHFILGMVDFTKAYYALDQDTVIKYYRLAIPEFIQALEFDPLLIEARSSLASCYNNIGLNLRYFTFHQRALEEYDKALKIDSSVLYIHLDRVRAMDNLKMSRDEICKSLKTLTLGNDTMQLDDTRRYLLIDLLAKYNCEFEN